MRQRFPLIGSGRQLDALIDALTPDAQSGLVAAVVQDHDTGDVLMLAYQTPETVRQTVRTGRMTYWSRSRQEVWVKGTTSGAFQHVRSVRIDCDGDALLWTVDQEGGAACHTGRRSCFYRTPGEGGLVEIGLDATGGEV
jgi:phosphoribosyl-AMP cyclohydrolase